MCGIIGYSGGKNAEEKLIAGLRALEYRGYDSAGIAVFSGENIRTVKSRGRIDDIAAKLVSDAGGGSTCGIGHTRWATHGAPSDVNAHPHTVGKTCAVHNGIIENYGELKKLAAAEGFAPISETDTELAVWLIDREYRLCGDPIKAISAAAGKLAGSYSLGILFGDRQGEIYATCRKSPLIVAEGNGESFISSDVTALLGSVTRFVRLGEGEIAVLRRGGAELFGFDGQRISKETEEIKWDRDSAEKKGYAHFMRKEISEEPEAITLTAESVSDALSRDAKLCERLLGGGRLHIVACGTAMHAGLLGKRLIEEMCEIETDVHIASEFRYSPPILKRGDVLLAISQSGETADTLAAMSVAKGKGLYTFALVNVVGSSVAREADSVLYTCAGPEIAVASTKAYQVQVAALYTIAFELAHRVGKITRERLLGSLRALYGASDGVREMISREDEIVSAANDICRAEDLFFIGRATDFALCEEASLKLKEVSYIHSEAYPAGELKHGTISLVTEGTLVIAFATQREVYGKISANIAEVRARGARVITVCASDFPSPEGISSRVIRLPACPYPFGVFSAAATFQLLAYHTAVLRGCDVDKPRNLAKSVTVE